MGERREDSLIDQLISSQSDAERAELQAQLVEQLALAIRAHRGDKEALARMSAGLNDPDLHDSTLLALRIVPLPQLRSQVEALSTRSEDETVRRHAERALLRMEQPSPGDKTAVQRPEGTSSGGSGSGSGEGTSVSGDISSKFVPPASFEATILAVDAPSKVVAGDGFKIGLRVRNSGSAAWPRSQPYRVDIDLRQPNRKARRLEDEWSGWLGEGVPPGGEINLESPIFTAPDPGLYLLEMRLYCDSRSTDFPPVESTHELEVTYPDTMNLERLVAKAPVEGLEKGIKVGPDKPTDALEPPEPPEPPELAAAAPEPVHVAAGDLEKIGGGFASPAVGAPAPQVTSHVVRIVTDLYTPPAGPRKLTLLVSPQIVQLKFANEPECVSPFKLDEAALRELEPDPIAYGQALFKMAINDDRQSPPAESTGHGYREAWRRTRGEMRLELVLYADELQSLAWERLNAGDSYPPFAASERSPLYRRVAVGQPTLADPPLEVLVAIADPARLDSEGKYSLLSGLASLDVAEQLETIEPELKLLVERGVVRYRVVPEDPTKPLTFEELSDALQNETHVLHLMAHGLRVKDKYHIVIGQEAGKRPFVDAKSFAELILGVNKNLKLAVLQACNSGEVIRGEASNMALGTLLVRGGFPAVISMRRQLGLATARYFNNRFYFHLARSEHVEMALAATRFNIYQRKIDGEGSWSVPVLHLGVDTGRLFGTDEIRAARLPDEEPRLARPELAQRERTGAEDAIEEAIRAASRKEGGLDAGDARSIREAAVKAATPVEPLARPQDRSRMNREMAKLVHLRGDALRGFVNRETGLDVPPAAYDQVASALNTGKHVVLIGPPGTGKTSLAHAIAEYARREGFSPGTIPTTASADWTTFDTVGGYVPVSADYLDFRPGIFLRAIASGCWLVLDEINRAEIDKAVGELFTVLSGQQVDLPYRIGGSPVRLLPARKRPHPRNWVPDEATGEYDYVVHPNWRIVATMNVYDKSSLFGLSFAFMRRFAFVDVGIPDEDRIFGPLRGRWADDFGSELLAEKGKAGTREALIAKLAEIFARDQPLMRSRELGPAIAKDMIHYVFDRFAQSEPPADPVELLGEAFLLYAVPQLDGLDRVAVREVHSHLDRMFGGISSGVEVLDRLETLYPHIRDWPARAPAAAQIDGPGDD